ncbi:hypothetical protein MM1S1540310_2823 [Mycobacteroides abscessus subsp. bolletii 1S-154-0310]|uniref:Uncharacterized protein n=2 Tax=Mycobacteroides abscessus TaxID=36809 RepID=A0A829QFF1_9MYCO|nr:hypothetical protein MM1S1530915_2814 [Mycobacteroides abscessus subsp. bolletii 1S-153-0915]EIU79368.1 hypothetical protein MM1S1540310_2823 [Mycobacteroides abscessus subsp. bolletii 1S-154-0310]EIV04826.1 hypothetical protein MM2B0307_2493 [Mycobacteroides abscessus subsp. bolletii 2B-0307]EIV22196.1 hypothetical protein MA3A0119R_3474 [Mycobacteroides abscessus 3A-0119-R]EIV33057.1 hypothetical protein MA3A0122S_3079 [Mycobacteroides abscessus 3A-0122-S]EIV37075.1 hypothetical protein M
MRQSANDGGIVLAYDAQRVGSGGHFRYLSYENVQMNWVA